MEELDLNIENYNLDDILDLFQLNMDFTYSELKGAIKILYKVHPDKSTLDTKYFIFFKEAYSVILGLYKHRESTNKTMFREEFYSKEKATKINKLVKNENFNKKFNELFEETFSKDTHGYDDWLKTNIVDFSKMDKKTYFTDNHNSIVAHRGANVGDININSGDNYIDPEFLEDYSSSMFNRLQYDDVKKAYSETYIPVNENDERCNMFNSVDELQRFRQDDTIDELTREESEQKLLESKYSENKQINYKIYNLIKEDKKKQQMNQKWWNKFNKLCY